MPAETLALFEESDIVWKGRLVDDVYRGSGNGASDATTVLHLIDGRFYNPTIQRFFTPGPVSLEQPNAYLLGGNDPLNRGPQVDWEAIEGPGAFNTVGSIGFGLIDTTPFGLLYDADIRAQTNDGYWFGLAGGIIGQVLLGNIAASVIGTTNAARVGTLGYQATRAAAYGYEAYATADALIGIGYSGYAAYRTAVYGDAFNPLSLIGFVPAVGFATRGYAIGRGYRDLVEARTTFGADSIGAARTRFPVAVGRGGSLAEPIELTDNVLRGIQREIARGQRVLLGENSVYRIGEQIFETNARGQLARTRFLISVVFDLGPRTGSERYSSRIVGRAGIGAGRGQVGFHLLGRQFGGSQYFPNVIPASGGLNAFPQGGYGALEAIWAQAARNGKSVDVIVDLVPGRWLLRPSSLRIAVSVDGSAIIRATLSNRADSFVSPRVLRTLESLVE